MAILYTVVCFTGLLLALTILLGLAGRYLVSYGDCKIDINAGERTLDATGGRSLLSALNESKIYIPSACGSRGSCGFCKVAVLSGGGPVLPTETPYLSRVETRTGIRLACQVKLRNDIFLRIPEELLNVRMFGATVQRVVSLTRDTKEIRLSLNEPAEISHRPGQYVQIQADSPGGPVFRAYSISSPVYDSRAVELIVRLVPGGIASTYIHGLKEGDPVAFTGPYGEFRLSEDPETEVVCVGGGCGMAPMRNIIYSLYAKWPGRACWLFFGCRTTKDVFYLDEFRALAAKHPNFKVVYALSDPIGPGETWDGESGFIHLAVDRMLERHGRRQAFLCGPPPMIQAVTEVLRSKGLRDSDVFYDKF